VSNWDDLRQIPWLIAVVGGPLVFALVVIGVMVRQRRRSGQPAVGDLKGDERPDATTDHPRRSLSGLGGQGWAWSGWGLPVFLAVIVASAAVYVWVK
jgi:hypothetical protein